MSFKSEIDIDELTYGTCPLEQPNIIINKACYHALLKDRDKLAALEQHGVDDWDGYEDAMVTLEEWNEQ